MDNKIYCIGCGVEIQSEDPKKQGYLPKNVVEKSEDSQLVCKRCFRLKNYNEVSDVELGADDFYQLIKSLSKKDALIAKVVDIFDFSGSWIEDVVDIVGNNKDIVLIANKLDLLPKSVKQNKIRQWLFKVFNSIITITYPIIVYLIITNNKLRIIFDTSLNHLISIYITSF